MHRTQSCLFKGIDQATISYFLETELRDTWVFEDSLTAIETAAKIGMPTVGIYDKYNYGQDRIKAIATEYINSKETLSKLVS